MSLSSAANDSPVSWTRFVLLCASLGVCAVAQWFIFRKIDWPIATTVLCVAAVGAAILMGRPRPLFPAVPPHLQERESTRRIWAGVVLTVAGLAAVSVGVYLLLVAWEGRFEIGWLAVVGGVALASIGLSLLDRRFRKRVAPIRWERWEIAVFTVIMLVGLFLRFYRYGDFPPPDGVCAVEEPQSGQGAYLAMNGLRWWEFMLDRWMPIPFWKAFGVSLTTLRLPFTIASWLTIVPLYLLLRQLVSRPAALFATGLFAICRWHLMYARLAHAIFGPTLPLILVAMYLCVKVHRRGGLAPYPWIGLLCGTTLFAYAGYRGTTAFVGLFLLISLIWNLRSSRKAETDAQRASARHALRIEAIGIAIAAIGFLAVALPVYSRVSMNPTYFVEAMIRAQDDPTYYSDNADLRRKLRVRRVQQTGMMFMHYGDGSATFNLPGAPQLDPVSATLFVIGLAYCLLFAFFRFQGFFALNFLALLVMGTIFVHNLDIRRLQGIIPLIFILVAFASDRFARLTIARCGLKARPVLLGLAVLLTGAAFYDNYDVYVRRMMNDRTVRGAFQNNYTVAYRYLRSLPENAYLLAITDVLNLFMPSDYEWLWRTGPPGHASNDLTPLFRGDEGPWVGRDLHLLIQKSQFGIEQLEPLLQERFPGTICEPLAHPDLSYTSYATCDLPRPLAGAAFKGGVTARYYRGDHSEPFLVRREPVIDYAFFPDECLLFKGQYKAPCRAEWEGHFEIAEAGRHQFLVQARRAQLRFALDGNVIHDYRENPPRWHIDDQVQRGVSLSAGQHQVRIEAKFSTLEYGGVRLQTRRDSKERWALVRFVAG